MIVKECIGMVPKKGEAGSNTTMFLAGGLGDVPPDTLQCQGGVFKKGGITAGTVEASILDNNNYTMFRVQIPSEVPTGEYDIEIYLGGVSQEKIYWYPITSPFPYTITKSIPPPTNSRIRSLTPNNISSKDVETTLFQLTGSNFDAIDYKAMVLMPGNIRTLVQAHNNETLKFNIKLSGRAPPSPGVYKIQAHTLSGGMPVSSSAMLTIKGD